MRKPLEGYRIIDLSTYVAAPVCCRLLGDKGAEVIKVEAPTGDRWRATGKSYRPRFTDDENPVFDIYNTGKKTISLNLKTPEGMEAMYKLLETADAFVTNNRPAALARRGLGYEQLKERFPKLVYGIILGYGEEGPDKDMPAFDNTAFWARSGFMRDMTVNNEQYHPVFAPSSVGDTFTGTTLALQMVAALLNREKTGVGELVRSGLYHNGVFAMGTMVLISQRPYGKVFPAIRTDYNVPAGAYRCSDDEWIFFAPGDIVKTLAAIFEMIGRPELIQEEKFNPKNSWTNRQELYAILKEGFLKNTADHWQAKGKEYDIPLMKLRHFADVAEDEQAWVNGYLEKVAYPTGNVDIMPTSPIEMESVGKITTTPAHKLGQDTRSVLADLGYSQAQIEAMLAAGAAIENP